MKKVFAALLLSTFTLGTFVATAGPMQQDTTKKHKPMKKDTLKTDTLKKPAKKK